MGYPALIVNYEKLKHNTQFLMEKCRRHGIDVVPVTKVYCGVPEIARASVEAGAKMLADSRIENIIKMKDIPVPKVLLRIPMKSQAEAVVEHVDISLNSEYDTIKAISDKAVEKGKVHKIVLMIDMGDLREGVWRADALAFAGKIVALEGVKLIGVGTNLTCYGGVIPSKDNLGKLVELAEAIESQYGIRLEIISGGNSSSIHLLDKSEMPKRVNQLRLGESIVLGNETAYGERIEGTYDDVFTFAAEIVELKEKPSIPEGEIGMDAFGEKPVFTDKGLRRRAILAAGRQDAKVDGLTPTDERIAILGASSDHLIVDITDCDTEYRIGDIITFKLGYGALLAAATSEYVNKIVE